MSHVFVSYVREDEDVVKYIVEVLRANDVEVWFDQDSNEPGSRWKNNQKAAIKSGKLFLAVFSRNWEEREKTEANNEVVEAIEELRTRPTDRSWFIPVRLDDCNIPDRSIGAGETLHDLQWVDFPKQGWESALTDILKIAGVKNPKTDIGEPLGTNLTSTVLITKGKLSYERTTPPIEHLDGLVFGIEDGWCTRTEEGHLLAYIETSAPHMKLQEINKQFGLDSFYAISEDGYVSQDPNNPNTFRYTNEHVLPAGSELWDMSLAQSMVLPFDMPVTTHFDAKGALVAKPLTGSAVFEGNFTSTISMTVAGQKMEVVSEGRFEMQLQNSLLSPEEKSHKKQGKES